ncbi:hypothetical protein M0R72_15965 [Candidatus Pacearchaeota archaeon]|nr:hypothetical protein [Candidatus Pacearchaeota archaeon]
MTKSKFVNGCQVYYDDYENRWVKAIGPNVREWEMRLGSDFTTAKEYTVTVVGGVDAVTQGILAGSRAAIATAATENNGVNIQVVGTPFQLESGKPCYFGVKMSASQATESDILVGLASTDTSLIAAHAITVINGCFFYKDDGATAITTNAMKASVNSAATVGTAMDTSKHVYEILFDGTSLSFFFDSALVNTITTGWPTAVITPSVAVMAGTTTAVTSQIEWMRCIQLG